MRSVLLFVLGSIALAAHPMGNFSVNHYSRLYARGGTVHLEYVLDLAEIPTFELLNQWRIDWHDRAALTEKSRQQGREWIANLQLLDAGRPLPLYLASVTAIAAEGAGGMPTLRIQMVASAAARAGEVSFEDRNYQGRAGWKEVVVGQRTGDLSGGLTHYPADPGVSPLQDLTARVSVAPPRVTAPSEEPPVVAEERAPEPPSFSQQQPTAAGTVVRGDYLSRLLGRRDIGWGLTLLGVLAAIGLGAIHALSPGHGKTIVAAYLVGSRGTLRHAGLLGLVVTFTHTFTVFLLGLGVLFFQKYVIPEKVVPVLGMISGLSIVAVGGLLLYRRAKALLESGHEHRHHQHHHAHSEAPELVAAGHHDHDHAHGRAHDHVHPHPHEHPHVHVHSHGGHSHSHMVEGKITPGSLIALGVSGGLVPCPSALILMLSAIALGRPSLGLLLLVGFSTGLAAVLMGIGFLVIYAKHLLPSAKTAMNRPALRLVPVFSAVVVIVLGLGMTAVSAGWLRPLRFL